MRDYPTTNALAVFHAEGHGLLSRYLHPKFRHVFCAVKSGDYWISIDGRNGKAEFEVVAGADYDLTSFYRSEGLMVVPTYRRREPVRSPLMAATCVGAVKRVLGISAPWVLTPRQLYRHLVR